MKGVIVAAVVLVVVGYFASQISQMVRAKMELTDRVTQQLDFVDEDNHDMVRATLVQEAAKWGVELDSGKVKILYQDTEQPTTPQRFLGRIAEFRNKKVAISVRYYWRILGFGIAQEITRAKIKQVEVRPKAPPPEYRELVE
ncbi:MAG: hypothetical protein RMM51_05230 [Verrucomicrobiae bacterium]|nr:hypothetical protein [Verrucomicrobiae bacterium]